MVLGSFDWETINDCFYFFSSYRMVYMVYLICFDFGNWNLSRKLFVSSRFSNFVEYKLLGSDDFFFLDFHSFSCYVSLFLSDLFNLDTVSVSSG